MDKIICPECGSFKYEREKGINGHTKCRDCGFNCSSREWDEIQKDKTIQTQKKIIEKLEDLCEYCDDENYNLTKEFREIEELKKELGDG